MFRDEYIVIFLYLVAVIIILVRHVMESAIKDQATFDQNVNCLPDDPYNIKTKRCYFKCWDGSIDVAKEGDI